MTVQKSGLGLPAQLFSTPHILALGPATGCSQWFCFLISKMKAFNFMTSNIISNRKILFLSYSYSKRKRISFSFLHVFNFS